MLRGSMRVGLSLSEYDLAGVRDVADHLEAVFLKFAVNVGVDRFNRLEVVRIGVGQFHKITAAIVFIVKATNDALIFQLVQCTCELSIVNA